MEDTAALAGDMWEDELGLLLFEDGAAPVVRSSVAQQEARQAHRRAIVAASSRRTRAKRKREAEELRGRKEELEQERGQMVRQLAELQRTVADLRTTGSFDLQLENRLLRAELAETRRFLEQIRALVMRDPVAMSGEMVREGERNKHLALVLQEGSAANVEQVLALCSSSMMDSTWQAVAAPVDPSLGRISFQCVPPWSSPSAASRVNLRMDVTLPVPRDVLRDILVASWSSESFPQLLADRSGADVNLTVEQISLPEVLEPSVSLGVWRESRRSPVKTVEEGATVDSSDTATDKDIVTLRFCREGQLLPSSLFPGSQDNEGVVDATVVSVSASKHFSSCAPASDHHTRVEAAFLEGDILRDVSTGSSAHTLWTHVVSYPRGCDRLASLNEAYLDDAGRPTPVFVHGMQSFVSTLTEDMHQSGTVETRSATVVALNWTPDAKSINEKWVRRLREAAGGDPNPSSSGS